jgi:cytochrome c oxidase assembly protein subunit 15
MWCAWYILHLPGLDAGSPATATILGITLCIVAARGAAAAHRPHTREGWVVGLHAGLVSAAINMLLLGSKVVQQPETTDQLLHAANRLRPDASMIILGFFAFSALVGAVGGHFGSLLAHSQPRPVSWLARFASVAALAFLPLLVVGGVVTSTESGMAVPDSVTTYGSISFLFPLSLMAEPRIFFEHTHRLFGTLVGLTTLVLAVWVISRHRAWLWAIAALGGAGALIAVFAARLADTLSQSATIASLGVIIAAALAVAVVSIAKARPAPAAALLLLLVLGQGLLGALRVSEISTGLAMAHGVLAQLVFGVAAALATLLALLDAATPEVPPTQTAALLRSVSRFAPWVVGAVVLQLILGAGYRHTASHAFLGGHVLFAVFVAAFIIVIGAQLSAADRFSDLGLRARRAGKVAIHLVSLQVVLGIVAVAFVTFAGSQRPIPLSHELEVAHALPGLEALFATAHQATGAALLALVVGTAVATRRLYTQSARDHRQS